MHFNIMGNQTQKKLSDLFDRLFDCLNVRGVNEDITKRKPNLSPYRSVNDHRLKVKLIILFIYTTIIMHNLYNNTAVCQNEVRAHVFM